MRLTRRVALGGLAACGFARSSLALASGNGPQRLVVILLRGGLDGLSVLAPYGDVALAPLRPGLMLPEPGNEGGVLDMGGFWGLHPMLPHLHAMFKAGELAPFHAVSGPTRSRSHFEAQDRLEMGGENRLSSGWLNRLAGLLPARAKRFE